MCHGILCRGRRLGGNGTDGAQEGRVDGTSKKEEFSAYLLDEFFALLVQQWCSRGRSGVLFLGTIFDGFGRERRVLWFAWRLVLELFEGLGFVTWHGQVDFAVVVVPVQLYANIVVTSPIGAEGVV